MAKHNPNVIYHWCFSEKYVEDWICQWFKFSSPTYFPLYHQVLLFSKGIYFIKQLFFVTSNNYYVTDSHFNKKFHSKANDRILKHKEQICFGSKKEKQF